MSTPTQNTTPTGLRFAVTGNPVAGQFNAFQVIDTHTGQRSAAAPFAYALRADADSAAQRLNDSTALIAAVMAALKVTDEALATVHATDPQRALEQVEDILRAVLPE